MEDAHSVNVSSVLRKSPSLPIDGVLIVPDDELETIDFDHVIVYAETVDFMYSEEKFEEERNQFSGYIDPEDYIPEPETFHVDNEFEIDEAELKQLDDGVKELTNMFRNQLLQQSITRHMAYDTASAEVEAVMRSQYGADVSVGGEFTHLLDCLGDLEMFDMLLTHSRVNRHMKAVLREQLCAKFIENATNVMEAERTSAVKSKRFRAELENYAAKIRNGSGDEGHRVQNVIGSVRSKAI